MLQTIFLFVPFLRFLFIFLMRSLSSIAPSSYGLFRPKPGGRAAERDVELLISTCYMNIRKGT